MTRPSPSASSPSASLVATWLPAAAGLVLVVLSVIGFGASTHGASTQGADEIGLSSDGQEWDDRDDWEPLFDPHVRWVPGDTRQESFYVRNQGPTPGALVVEFVIDDPDGMVADQQLSLRARVDGDDWQPFTGDSPSLVPLSLDRGEVVQVDVEASLAWDAPNSTMDDHVSIDIRTTLTEVEDADGPSEEPGTGRSPGGSIPGTGGDVGTVVLLAVLTIGSGLALVLRSRRTGAEQ